METSTVRTAFYYNFKRYTDHVATYWYHNKQYANSLTNFNNYMERFWLLMAKQSTNKGKFTFGDTKFAAIKLDENTKAEFNAWYKDANNGQPEQLGELCVMGWKFSISWDNHNDCFISSLTQRDESDRNYNVCVTSRSDDLTEAIYMGVYKISVMFDGKKIPTELPKDNWG